MCNDNQDEQSPGIEETREDKPSSQEGRGGLAEGKATDRDCNPARDIDGSAAIDSCVEQAHQDPPLVRPHLPDSDPSSVPEDRVDSSSSADIAPFDKAVISSNAEEESVAIASTTMMMTAPNDTLATSDYPLHAELSDIAPSHEAVIATSRDEVSLSHGVITASATGGHPAFPQADAALPPETRAAAGSDSVGASRTIMDESADAESGIDVASTNTPGLFTSHSEEMYGDTGGETGQAGHLAPSTDQV